VKKRNIVNSKSYRLISPEKIEEVMLQHTVNNNQVVIQPSLASICHADIRYYSGQRRKEALKNKLPMTLFHEGIGHVISPDNSAFDEGERVVIVPNIPARRLGSNSTDDHHPSKNRVVSDNYLSNSLFLGSGYDGIAQQYMVLPAENLVSVPNDVPGEIAVLTELTSVSLHAANNVNDYLYDGKVVVFGDGPVGYLTAATLHHVYDISKDNLLVFGTTNERLANFDFATTYFVQDFNFRKEGGVVAVFECTGGKFSNNAINQAIDLIDPQGKIVLMGVSEEYVPINTRDILEKGLRIYGSSRSTEKEFKFLMNAFQSQAYQHTLKKLIPAKSELIKNAEDLDKAMHKAVKNKDWKKTYLSFKWD